MSAAKRLIRTKARLRNLWWSFQNWCRGYAWGPIQRCRNCAHTSPYHYPPCASVSPVQGPRLSTIGLHPSIRTEEEQP